MYWTSNNEGRVWRANLDGTSKQIIASQLLNPLGLVLDLKRQKVYWADHHAGKIQRANLDGSEVEDVITGHPSQIEGLALKSSLCPGDFDNDGAVGAMDFLTLLGTWGDCPMCPEDLQCDDFVGVEDLMLLLAAWGPCV